MAFSFIKGIFFSKFAPFIPIFQEKLAGFLNFSCRAHL